ncbi:hypothetical protein CI109_105812 [Kwoniella shandongensis]|uniref:Uncharacterized protein n=1 Tax=Kwoniella shandongensis TaxID=1734106 RepID=A0A5M6C611_9TREE|nr:uncharacterized protein CI109_003151 [Kwoniella shandongensis]KAA5528619.1 hypothetical protein CI109_003151 [Kwoniella shandongensis]
MVYIKSSVLVAAAAFSATTSALPASGNSNYDATSATASPSKAAAVNLNIDLGSNVGGSGDRQSVPSLTSPTDLASATATPLGDLLDVDVQVAKDTILSRDVKSATPSRAGTILRAQPQQGKDQPAAFGSHDKSNGNDRVWKGKLGRRGPWRNVPGDNLIDINIGGVAATPASVPADLPSGVPHRQGYLIDLNLRSHDDRHDRVILTGDGDAYYRNADRHHHGHEHGHTHEHVHVHDNDKRHSHNHHTVLEVIGDGDRRHGHEHGHRYENVIVDDGRSHDHGHDHVHEHIHGDDGYVYGKRRHDDHETVKIIHDSDEIDHEHGHEHEHIHGHMDKRRHSDSDRVTYIDHTHGRPVEVIEVGNDRYRHRSHRPHDIEVINVGHDDVHEHIHEHTHIHARSHGREGGVVVVEGGSHRHGGDVTVVNNDNHNDRHHRHSGSTTVVNNDKRDIPGLTSKLAGLGRAFLKKARSHDDKHDSTSSTTIINNSEDRGRHGHGHSGDSSTVIVNNDGKHHRHHDSDTTVINNNSKRGHHHSDRILVVGDERRYHNADFYYRNSWDRGLRNGRPIYFTNGDDFNRVRMVGSRHGGAEYVTSVPQYESTVGYEPVQVGYEPVGYEYYKRSHGGESRKERYDRHSSKHGKKQASPKKERTQPPAVAAPAEPAATEDGEEAVDEASNAGEKRRWRGDGETVVNEGGRHHRHGGDVTIVNNEKRRHEQDDRHRHDSERYCHDGRCDFTSSSDRHDHHGHHADGFHYDHHHNDNEHGGDVTVVNNMGKRRHDEHRYHHNQHQGGHHSSSEECRDGRCDRRGGDVTIVNNDKREPKHERPHGSHGGHRDGDDVTVVNNYKRQVAMNSMGGAPGYIDVTSPVFNSTTAQRIASLVLSTSNGTDANSTFVLNASNNIRTQVYLVPLNPSNSTTSSSTMSAASSSANATIASTPLQVNLKLPIFVASSASVEPYCATFDPSPESPAPLTVMPCTNDTSTHESQVFLYNPDTGVIHPDWQPSTDAQQLLQAVSDDVDDSQDDAMITASASATMIAAESYQTDLTAAGAWGTMSDSITPSATASTTGWMRRATAAAASPTTTTVTFPSSTSASGPASGSSTSGSASSTASSPPPLMTSGPSSSTDSKSIPQSNTASNVTLIFTPATPAMINNAASLNDDDNNVDDVSEPQTQATLSRRWHTPDYDGEGRHLNREAYTGDLPKKHSLPVVPASSSGNPAVSSTTPVAAAAGVTIAANAKAIVPASAVAQNLPKGDWTMPLVQSLGAQRPMVAPQSLTAPYEWRWTADSANAQADSASVVA